MNEKLQEKCMQLSRFCVQIGNISFFTILIPERTAFKIVENFLNIKTVANHFKQFHRYRLMGFQKMINTLLRKINKSTTHNSKISFM